MGVITIDGPSRSGKTTLARSLAVVLGVDCLETGYLYRGVALAAVERNVDLANAPDVESLLDDIALCSDRGRIILWSADVTDQLRRPIIDTTVPVVAQIRCVRAFVTNQIREWAGSREDCIIEGRDIGSAVMPNAKLKLFLSADPHIRVLRDIQAGPGVFDKSSVGELLIRDAMDSGRTHDPLVMTHDMIFVDTSERGVDEIIAMILRMLSG